MINENSSTEYYEVAFVSTNVKMTQTWLKNSSNRFRTSIFIQSDSAIRIFPHLFGVFFILQIPQCACHSTYIRKLAVLNSVYHRGLF